MKSLVPDANVCFHLGDWWAPLKPWWGSFDLVLANPPYIPQSVFCELEPMVREHEPAIALCGGVDGLHAFRQILKNAKNAMSSNAWLIFEHHYDQSEKLISLMDDYGLQGISSLKDIEGIKRFAIGKITY